MKKRYSFEYEYGPTEAVFEVDLEIFTPDHAKATLNFFTWTYDEEADPIDEVMKKYALAAIRIASFNNYNVRGVVQEFEELEGYGRIDGEIGIRLTYIFGFEFDPSDLEMKSEVLPF